MPISIYDIGTRMREPVHYAARWRSPVMGQSLKRYISQQADARGKHMISEPWIEIHSQNDAAATTDFAWVSRTGVVGQSGRYVDTLTKSDDRWQFQRREIVFTGDQPV